MYFIETRHFKGEHLNKNLIVNDSDVLIQARHDDDVVLEEYRIPHYKKSDGLFVSFLLDEKIFKMIQNDYYIIIFQEHIENSGMIFKFDPIDYVVWDTYTSELSCVVVLPEPVQEYESEELVIECKGHVTWVHDNNISYNIPCSRVFKEGRVTVPGYNLYNIFEKNSGKACKLYITEGQPLCIEFFDDYRIFIAPC